jgi:hypothetical protein
MDIASGLVFHVDRRLRSDGVPPVLAALTLLMLVALVVAVVGVGLLPAASEPVTVAPLR